MIKEILQIGAPILTQKTKPVAKLNDNALEVIGNLLDTCKANSAGTAGLAAPQIGSNLRICVCRRVDLEDAGEKPKADALWEVLINPEVKVIGKEESIYWEGCLSIGKKENLLYGPVARADSIIVSYLDRNMKKQELSAAGFFSHVVQHEVDHLDGILFLKYINNPKNIWKAGDLDKYLNEQGEYPPVL